MNNLLKRFVVPQDGARVINPATGEPLPRDGALVDYDEFWVRRVTDGDVRIQEPKAPGAGVARIKSN